MWIEAENGSLVNLDKCNYIYIEGERACEVRAVFNKDSVAMTEVITRGEAEAFVKKLSKNIKGIVRFEDIKSGAADDLWF